MPEKLYSISKNSAKSARHCTQSRLAFSRINDLCSLLQNVLKQQLESFSKKHQYQEQGLHQVLDLQGQEQGLDFQGQTRRLKPRTDMTKDCDFVFKDNQ